jgi:hypothetical protein
MLFIRQRGLCHLLNDKRLWFGGTARSELFRAEHCGDQIEEEEHGDQADNEIFHGGGG